MSALTLSACAKFEVKDAEFCGDMGELGASCFHTLSDKQRDIEKAPWEKERFGMICTSSDNFAAWKELILKFCEETKKCTYKVEETVQAVAQRFERNKLRRGKK